MLFDVFISHASEDKDDLVRPVAAALQQNRVEVWYDEFSLRAGDSLRRSIDIGLSKCRYGVVVLSKHSSARSGTATEFGRQATYTTGVARRHACGCSRVLTITGRQ